MCEFEYVPPDVKRIEYSSSSIVKLNVRAAFKERSSILLSRWFDNSLVVFRRRAHRENPVVEIDSRKLGDLEYQSTCGPRHYDTTPPTADTIYPPSVIKDDNFGNAYYRTWELQRKGMSQGGVGAHGQGSQPHFHPGGRDETTCAPDRYGGDLEHIYESPKSVRREFVNANEALQYYELDPNLPENQNLQKSKFGNTS